MQTFQSILFVSTSSIQETEALKQALWLADKNNASLKALIIYPEFPQSLAEYKDKFEAFIKEQLNKCINDILSKANMLIKREQIHIEIQSGSTTPAIRIIRHVLRHKYDLLIKDVETIERGFKSIDMELLRKCPCAVWLCRPHIHTNDNIRIAVAIDPQSETEIAHDLSLRLLQTSYSLTNVYSKKLHIISCWNYELEDYIRDSVWIDLQEEKIQEILTETQIENHHALASIIKESGIGEKMNVLHFKGSPDQIIPNYVSNKKIDLLVMGTVARTGIDGFLIGNTAENVMQKINCSLLALKPNGFVSPVKAY